MWTLYLTATKTGQRPSDLVCVEDRWAALQFDNAVTLVGTVIENAAQEMEQRGSDDKPRWEPKYTMEQLLDPAFRLPRDGAPAGGGIDELRGIEGLNFDVVG